MIPSTKPMMPRTLPVPRPFIAINPRIIARTDMMAQSFHTAIAIIPSINAMMPTTNVSDFAIIMHTLKG